ncbi:MAG: pilus assembly protein PilM [Candidatus Omnitrophica bacterium]|nr:pilus assembly protein PilM [Candidatus Omnitrophota bacterium]
MEWLKFLKFRQGYKRTTCIDFGGSFIKIAFLQTGDDSCKLLAYALEEFDTASSTSEGISAFLKQVLESHKISGKQAYLSISDPEGIFIKKLSLPHMPKDELLKAVRWQLKSELPFAVEESVSDLQVIRECADNEGAKKIEIFCVFAKKEVINKYVLAVIACGLEPQRVSSSVFNYCGILEALSGTAQSSAIFDIGHTHSYISIYQNNKLSFVRSLNFSILKFSASLCASLVTDKGKVEICFDKAEQLTRQEGIPLDETTVLDDGIRTSQLIPLMRPLLETAAKEIERSFDYFNSESGSGNPEVLYITGGGANLKNLDSYLARQLNMKVEKLPFPALLDIRNVDAEKFFLDVSQLSSAIGLSLSVSGINLLPPEIRGRKIELIQKSALRVTTVAIAAMFAFSWFVISFQARDYKKRLKIARLHLQNVEEVKILKQEVDLRDNFIAEIHSGKVPSGGLLKLIGSVVPENIILNEFDFDQLSHTMQLNGVVLAGGDPAEKVLTEFMQALEGSKFIQEANLVNSKEEQGGNSFEIDCLLAK